MFRLEKDSGSVCSRGFVGLPKPKPRGSKGAPYWACRGASMGAVRLTEGENWTGAEREDSNVTLREGLKGKLHSLRQKHTKVITARRI